MAPGGISQSAGNISRRDWRLGIALLTVALVVHALVPRCEYILLGPQDTAALRVNRWTGAHQVMFLTGDLRRR